MATKKPAKKMKRPTLSSLSAAAERVAERAEILKAMAAEVTPIVRGIRASLEGRVDGFLKRTDEISRAVGCKASEEDLYNLAAQVGVLQSVAPAQERACAKRYDDFLAEIERIVEEVGKRAYGIMERLDRHTLEIGTLMGQVSNLQKRFEFVAYPFVSHPPIDMGGGTAARPPIPGTTW